MRCSTRDFRQAARRVLPRFAFDFVDGGADDEQCMARNRRDLDALTLVPRVLRDTTRIDPAIEVFGSPWQQPFAVTPTGFNGLCRPDGDLLLARAAAEAGVPFVVATPSNVRLEALRAALPTAELWLQLYVLQDRKIAEQLMRRAAALGFKALVLTVDVPVSGSRRRDLGHGFTLPLRPSLRLAWDLATHPAWAWRQLRHGLPDFANLSDDPGGAMSAQAHAALLARTMDRSLAWDDLAWVRAHWKGPLVLKGLLHPADAGRAIALGVDAITVSNHGGRQLDAAPSSIAALPAMVDAVDGRVPVFVDSGFRSGADVVRALALGATAVFFGRPLLYALGADGLKGVQALMRLLAQELERTMVLLGTPTVSAIGPEQLRRCEPSVE